MLTLWKTENFIIHLLAPKLSVKNSCYFKTCGSQTMIALLSSAACMNILRGTAVCVIISVVPSALPTVDNLPSSCQPTTGPHPSSNSDLNKPRASFLFHMKGSFPFLYCRNIVIFTISKSYYGCLVSQ